LRPIPLPKPKATALAANLTIKDRDVELTTHSETPFLWLRLATEDSLFLEQKIAGKLALKLTNYPAGVYRATLTDPEGNDRWERLLFLEPQLKPSLSNIVAPKPTVPWLNFKLTDQNGEPLRGDFSLAVVDDARYTRQNDKQPHIIAQLLLQSQLRGKIFEVNDYFDPEQPAARRALDDVVLCHGWRGLDWELTLPPRFDHEQTGIFGKSVNNGLFPSKPKYEGVGHRYPYTREEKVLLKRLGEREYSLRLPRLDKASYLRINQRDIYHRNRLLMPLRRRFRTTAAYPGPKTTVPTLTNELELATEATAAAANATTGKQAVVVELSGEDMSGSLEEVVVVGYGYVRKSDLTGSVARTVSSRPAQYDYSIADSFGTELREHRSFSLLGGELDVRVKRRFPRVIYNGENYLPRGEKKKLDPLLWTPVVQPDDTGRVQLACQPVATTKTFRAILEGITDAGLPVHAEATFATRADAEMSTRQRCGFTRSCWLPAMQCRLAIGGNARYPYRPTVP